MKRWEFVFAQDSHVPVWMDVRSCRTDSYRSHCVSLPLWYLACKHCSAGASEKPGGRVFSIAARWRNWGSKGLRQWNFANYFCLRNWEVVKLCMPGLGAKSQYLEKAGAIFGGSTCWIPGPCLTQCFSKFNVHTKTCTFYDSAGMGSISLDSHLKSCISNKLPGGTNLLHFSSKSLHYLGMPSLTSDKKMALQVSWTNEWMN